jgi:hypothetical protein
VVCLISVEGHCRRNQWERQDQFEKASVVFGNESRSFSVAKVCVEMAVLSAELGV